MNVEEELLDSYLAALGAFYDARKLSLTRWLLRDSGAREATEARLREVRHQYWSYIEACHSHSQSEDSGKMRQSEPGKAAPQSFLVVNGWGILY